MVQFKVQILVSLVFTILNSCNAQTKQGVVNQINNELIMADTIIITSLHYRVIESKKGVLDIEITDKIILDSIYNLTQPTIKIEIDKAYFIAKGNNFLSSAIPENCDFFYPINNNGKVLMNKTILNLREISKATD